MFGVWFSYSSLLCDQYDLLTPHSIILSIQPSTPVGCQEPLDFSASQLWNSSNPFICYQYLSSAQYCALQILWNPDSRSCMVDLECVQHSSSWQQSDPSPARVVAVACHRVGVATNSCFSLNKTWTTFMVPGNREPHWFQHPKDIKNSQMLL